MAVQLSSVVAAPGVTVVTIAGSITAGRESQTLVPFLRDIFEKGGRRLVVDLAAIEHLDSSGLELLFECFTAAKTAGAEMKLGGAGKRVAKLFQITRLDTVMPFYATVAEAVQSFAE